MHGFGTAFALLVNAEVDSMGGVIEGGGGIGTKTSPRQAAIERVQAELRQEYDFREERRRELEFLEKGGDPLEFKLGNAASVSVQSTSLTEHPDQFVTSDAKGSFALTASPHGDSVESRPGAPLVCEPNSADNLMLFDGENELLEGDRNSVQPSRNVAPSERSFQLGGSQNARELGDSAAFGVPRKAYRRRYRSRPNREGVRSSSTDVILARSSHGPSLPARYIPKDVKGSVTTDMENWKDQNISSNRSPQPSSSNCDTVSKIAPSESPLDMEMDGERATNSTADLGKCGPSGAGRDANTSKEVPDDHGHQHAVVDPQVTPAEVTPEGPERRGEGEEVGLTGLECQPCIDSNKAEDPICDTHVNGFSSRKGDVKSVTNYGQSSVAAVGTKGLESESSCTQNTPSLDGNNDSEMCTKVGNANLNGNVKEGTVVPDGASMVEVDKVKEKKENKDDNNIAFINDECSAVKINHQENGFLAKAQEQPSGSGFGPQDGLKDQNTCDRTMVVFPTVSDAEGKSTAPLDDNSNSKNENDGAVQHQGSIGSLHPKLHEDASAVVTVGQTSGPNVNLATKADEDSILEEARIIEAKRKRIAELSVAISPTENHRKSHWDHVLEEMAWLANDFAQERLWKITAAAQVCHRVAFTSRLRFQQQDFCWKQKKIAHNLAKAIMAFWHSVEESSQELEVQSTKQDSVLAVRQYALRFLKYNNLVVPQSYAEAPATPDRIRDSGTVDMSWEDHLTEENLFYTVPPGAIETYRKSIETHVLQIEKTGSSMLEEVETSACDVIADFASQDNLYEEEEGETSTYDSRFSRFAQKKQKNSMKSYRGRSFEFNSDSPFMQCMENKVGGQQAVLGKRPATSLNVSIPTKRVRTASRPRILSPFNAGTSGCIQLPNKTDASSGDTNSFQDDQSTLHGGAHMPNNLEVESGVDFEKQLPYDSGEVSMKPKKKKKAKHLGSAYEPRWQADSNFQTEQRDHPKKRLDSQLESNGSSGLFSQHISKKPKMMRQSLENSLDNIAPIGSVPSPVASQMSNMSNPNKIIRILGGRDRGRKTKALKVPAGQPGSGSPWSLFEDQALVVLVHDMGPNWELVSDAINSTLQFKCIYRKPKECKERHKILMDRTPGDGADSAEDSGSSQPYPSTLPGIPKGSARQLFQRLQGPMEEDTLKSHFEKIIMIGQKHHCRKTQNDDQDSKPLQQPHISHGVALSQLCPNNPNGAILTPLDLCDATASSPDIISLGYQAPHASGLAISGPGALPPTLPTSGASSAIQGSPNAIIGNNFSSSSPLNSSVRDGRYGGPRSGSLSIDEQQRMQQYNQMLSGRNVQQSSLSASGPLPGTERGGVRMLPGGSGMGVMCGVNRGVAMNRPGFQGIPSSSMLNSGSMLSSGMVAMPGPVNIHSGASSAQGNSLLRPRDGSQMMRPNQNQEAQRQMMVPELPMQVSQASSQSAPSFGGLSSSFPNQTASAPVSSYPIHHQQSHPVSSQQPHMLNPHHPHLQGASHSMNPQHQAYAIRLAKQRFLHQQQQQQQQFSTTNSLMPHVQTQPQPQLPISSPLQNNSQIQPQASSTSVSLSPLTSASSVSPMPQHQLKHPMPSQGLGRNPQTGASSLTNQVGKQRRQPQQQPQQQQFQQPGRQHPQQRQQSQTNQQAKLLKGVGRGNMMLHQNMQIDPSLLNGISTNPGNQSADKVEQAMHLMQGQGLYSGSALNAVQTGKPSVPANSLNQSQAQQKMYASQGAQSTKHSQQISSHSDNSNQGHVPPVAGPTNLSACHQSVSPIVMSSPNHQQSQPQLQPHQRLGSQNQLASQRLQQSRQMNLEPASKLQVNEPQADHSMSNSCQMGTVTTLPQDCNDATNATPVVSPANGAQWKASEPLFDSVGTPPTNSAGSDILSQVGQGLGQRKPSGSLSPVGRDVSAQWQQQSQLQPPPSPVPQQQQQQLQQLTQQQLPLSQQSQQQVHILPSGNSSLYVRPTDSRLE